MVEAVAKVVSFGRGNYSESGMSGRRDGGWKGRRKDETASVIEEVVAQLDGSGGEGAARAKCLAQGSDQNVGLDSQLGAESSSGGAEAAECMGFVDNEGCIIGLGDRGEGGQGRYIAIHAEEGLGYQEASAPCGTETAEMVVGGVSVEVGVDREFGA